MKRIICRVAQRKLDPSGWLANHVGRCDDCQSYFNQVQAIEKDLHSAPEQPDEDLCISIMAKIELGEQRAPARPAFGFPIRPWVLASGLAATAAVVLAILAITKPEQPNELVTDPPPTPDQPVVSPTPQLEPAREQTLAYVMQQQELLQRDFQKLGAHLRENLALFQPVDR